MFTFTSVGGKVHHSVNNGRGPFCFRMLGENYYMLGDLLPKPNESPKFAQLYIFDTCNEIQNRINAVSNGASFSSSSNNAIDYQLSRDIKDMLDQDNHLVRKFGMAGERLANFPDNDLKLRLIGSRPHDGRNYDLPTTSEVVALIVGDFDTDERDIIIHKQNGKLKRISELHISYMSLYYQLMFPYAKDGYKMDIYHSDVINEIPESKRSRVITHEWFEYRIIDRPNVFFTIPNGRRLFQQFLVDGFTMVEAERLGFVLHEQKESRCKTYYRLARMAENSNDRPRKRGKKVTLPASFTGSLQYMLQNYLDAMAMCKSYGFPDLLIKFTCNPNGLRLIPIGIITQVRWNEGPSTGTGPMG